MNEQTKSCSLDKKIYIILKTFSWEKFRWIPEFFPIRKKVFQKAGKCPDFEQKYKCTTTASFTSFTQTVLKQSVVKFKLVITYFQWGYLPDIWINIQKFYSFCFQWLKKRKEECRVQWKRHYKIVFCFASRRATLRQKGIRGFTIMLHINQIRPIQVKFLSDEKVDPYIRAEVWSLKDRRGPTHTQQKKGKNKGNISHEWGES